MNIDPYPTPEPIAFERSSRELGVVVGFDGSTQSILALHYGALEAQRSGRALTVVTAFKIPVQVYATLAALPEESDATHALEAAAIVLNDARRYLQGYPGKVDYRSARGDAAGVLKELSRSAELMVVGARGHGGFLGRMLGSVSSALPAHAGCPTIVVPRHFKVSDAEGAARFAPQPDSRPVIVGMDGSRHSRVAALHAAQAADDRGTTLRLLMALPALKGWLEWYPELDPLGEGVVQRRKAELERDLQAEAAWIGTHFPHLTIEAAVDPGDPIAQLIAAARDAQLTVVGTRGRSGFTGALMGSVSRGVVLRAAGPVMIVPDLKDERLSDQPEPQQQA